MKKAAVVSLVIVLIAGAALAQGLLFDDRGFKSFGPRSGHGPGGLFKNSGHRCNGSEGLFDGPERHGDGRRGARRGQAGGILGRIGRFLSGGPFMKAVEKLELTEEQSKNLEAIREETLLTSIDFGAALLKDSIKFRSLMKSDAPDAAEAEKLVDSMAASGAGLGKAITRAMIKAKAVLTPEQRKKVMEFMKNRGQRGGKRALSKGRGDGWKGCDGWKGGRKHGDGWKGGRGHGDGMNRDDGCGDQSEKGRHRGMGRGHSKGPLGILDFDSFEEQMADMLAEAGSEKELKSSDAAPDSTGSKEVDVLKNEDPTSEASNMSAPKSETAKDEAAKGQVAKDEAAIASEVK